MQNALLLSIIAGFTLASFFLMSKLKRSHKGKKHYASSRLVDTLEIKTESLSKLVDETEDRENGKDNESVAVESIEPSNSDLSLSHFYNAKEVGNTKLEIYNFTISKLGNVETENEDAFCIGSNINPFRVSVADGATESIFSNIWSNLLVNEYVKSGVQSLQSSGMSLIYKEFIEKTNNIIEKMPETRQWLMYEKMARGTHATLAALELSDSLDAHLITIGDACIFWRDQNDQSVKMQPDLNPEDFDSFPDAICHVPETWKLLDSKLIKQEVQLGSSFQVILCTDAFGCWLAKSLNHDLLIWDKVFQITSSDEFYSFVGDIRSNNEIKNDDITLVTINALPLNV